MQPAHFKKLFGKTELFSYFTSFGRGKGIKWFHGSKAPGESEIEQLRRQGFHVVLTDKLSDASDIKCLREFIHQALLYNPDLEGEIIDSTDDKSWILDKILQGRGGKFKLICP